MPFIAILTFKYAVEQQLIVAISKAIKHLESMSVQQIKYLHGNLTLKSKYYVGKFYVQEIVALRTVSFCGAQQSHRIVWSLPIERWGIVRGVKCKNLWVYIKPVEQKKKFCEQRKTRNSFTLSHGTHLLPGKERFLAYNSYLATKTP